MMGARTGDRIIRRVIETAKLDVIEIAKLDIECIFKNLQEEVLRLRLEEISPVEDLRSGKIDMIHIPMHGGDIKIMRDEK